MEDDAQMERMRIAGLPVYPPHELQLALDQASRRWQEHALAEATDGVVVLGTNHLLPWHASRVAELLEPCLQDAAASTHAAPAPNRSPPRFRSVAVELAPARRTAAEAAAEELDVVLAELAHLRFRRFPDLRALQRLLGSASRARAAERMEAHGLEALDVKVWGFGEGMELLQALRVGRLAGLPVACVDLPLRADALLAAQMGARDDGYDDDGHAARGAGRRSRPAAPHGAAPAPARDVPAGASSAASLVHVDGEQAELLRQAERWMGRRGGDAAAASGGEEEENGGAGNAAAAGAMWEAQAAWRERARDALEAGVDRGLVVGDEHACVSRYLDAFGEPAALAAPRHLRAFLPASLGGRPGAGACQHKRLSGSCGGWGSGGGLAAGGAPWCAGGAEGGAPPLGVPSAAGREEGRRLRDGGGGQVAAGAVLSPQQAQHVQDLREWFMSLQLVRMPRPVLAVVGAAHVAGVLHALRLLRAAA